MLTLFFSPGTCSLASLIALEESGLAFEAKRIQFHRRRATLAGLPEDQSEGPRSGACHGRRVSSPKRRRSWRYIAALAPEAGLAPLDDPSEFARLQAFNNYICSTVHVNHAHGRRGSRWADDPAAHEAMKAKVPETMTASFMLIEEKMLAGPWVMGERYSVADAYLFVMTGWLRGDGVDPMRFSKATAHYARMMERPPCSVR